MFRQLDVQTGKVRWETNVRRSAPKYFFHGDVFIAPDRIVASADVEAAAGTEAGFHAFDRPSGRQLWMHAVGRGAPGAVVGSSTHVFAYTVAGALVALSLKSGRLEWSYDLKADGWESPAVVGQRVFGGSGEGSIVAFNAENGRVAWQRRIGAAVSTSVGANDAAVYAGTKDGTMHRLSAGDGAALASLKLDGTLKPSSAPLVRPDAVLALMTDAGMDYRALVSMDPTLSRINWRRAAADRWSTTRIFATGKTIALGTPAGEITAYCVADGASAWTQKLSSAPIRSIGGTDEILFAGTPQGTLYAIRPPRSCM